LNAPASLELTLGEDRVDAARVAALFGIAKAAYATTLVGGTLVFAVLWNSAPAMPLVLWYATLAAVTLARVALHRAYERGASRSRPGRWELRFAAGAAASGLLWAVPVAAFFPEHDPVLRMALVLVAACTMMGAAGLYAASKPAFYWFCVPPLLAALAQLARQPGEPYALLAVGGLAFAAAMLRVFHTMHVSLVGALRAHAEKEALLQRAEYSEARLRDAIEGFPEGIAVVDEERRTVVSNAAYARIATEAGEATPAVRQFRSRDGRWMQAHYARTPRGSAVGVFTDISDAKRAQAAYQAALAEKDLVLDALPVGVAFVEQRTIARCNARLERMLGYAVGELAGQSARVLYPSEDAWHAGAAMYERLRDGSLFEGDGELVRKDGTRLWCRGWARALDPGAPQEAAIIVFSDVSERRAAEQALRESEALFRGLVETSNDLVWSVDREGRWTYLNAQAVRRLYGRPAAELFGHPFYDSVAQPLRERDQAVMARVLAGEPVFRHETRHLRSDGSSVDLSINAVPRRGANGEINGATGTARDVTDERRATAALHESVEKLRLAVEAGALAYWEWDQSSGEVHWGRDPAGRPGARESRTLPWSEYVSMVHPDDRERYLAETRDAWARNVPFALEFRAIGAEGQVAWISARGRPLTDAAGRVTRMIGVSQDITEKKRRDDEERFLAYHDSLTGLPNRRLLDDRLRQALRLAQRRDARLAVMLVDLDEFKHVNDRHGHRAGDVVLCEVARRMQACVRKADTLARQGGDEFVVVMPDLAPDSGGQVVADKILRALGAPLEVEGATLSIGASIGVSIYPADAGDGEALLRNADAAMYRAKQAGGGQVRHFGR
jgi:diguanylate cyclase (GGDEF)-like protein/PAS domain S-box-containing protein